MDLPQHLESVYKDSACLFTKEEVEAGLQAMAKTMTLSLADKNPIFLCVVIGGIIPLGHLLTHLDFPLEVNYIHATRYTGKTAGSELTWRAEPTCSLEDRTVVIVDDILDRGVTLSAIVAYCEKAGAKEVKTAVMVDKPSSRTSDGLANADYVALVVEEDPYVFGYGLDYKEYLRNAPGIFAVSEAHLEVS